MHSENGGLTSTTIAKCNDCWIIPPDLSSEYAAVIPLCYGTALLAFSTLVDIKENDYIIVTVGPAGLGRYALRVYANFGLY